MLYSYVFTPPPETECFKSTWIRLQNIVCFIRYNDFVNPSALQRSVDTYFNFIRPLLTESRTVDCRMRKCLFRAEILSELDVIIAAVLSISVTIGLFEVQNSS